MNTNTNDGRPAFPTQNGTRNDPGMTLRDWFAGQALAGMLDRTYGIPVIIIAERSYQMADAMLAARDGKGEE